MKRNKLYDETVGNLGPKIGRDGVERIRLTDAEFGRLREYSQAIKVGCDCNWDNCTACRNIGKLKWYAGFDNIGLERDEKQDYRIVKALIDELAELKEKLANCD